MSHRFMLTRRYRAPRPQLTGKERRRFLAEIAAIKSKGAKTMLGIGEEANPSKRSRYSLPNPTL